MYVASLSRLPTQKLKEVLNLLASLLKWSALLYAVTQSHVWISRHSYWSIAQQNTFNLKDISICGSSPVVHKIHKDPWTQLS